MGKVDPDLLLVNGSYAVAGSNQHFPASNERAFRRNVPIAVNVRDAK